MLRLNLLFLTAFLVGADEFLLGPILTPIGHDLSVAPERIALFVTAYSLPLALMAPLLGGVSDRFGRRAVLVPATLAFGLASIATALAPTFEAGLATRVLTGAASGGMLGVAMAMAGDLGGKAAPRAIAFVTSGLTLGIILSPGIGALATAFQSWRAAFAALGALSLLVGLLGLTARPAAAAPGRAHAHAQGPAQGPAQGGAPGAAPAEPLFAPGACGSLIAMAAGLGGAVGCFALVGERLRALYDWDTATVSVVYAAFGVLTLLGNAAMPLALARVGGGRALMRIALAVVLPAIAVVFAPDGPAPAFVLLALAIWAVCGGMGAPGLQTHVAELSQSRRGALMALAGSAMNLGVAGATALASSVYPAGAAWVAVVALALIAVAIAALRPAPAQAPAPTPAPGAPQGAA